MGRVILVAGLGFGDEGKGSVVDYLVRQYNAKLVARYNGGPQAAHHVITPNGTAHCFSQFGSGTFVPNVRTYLSRFMLVDPLALVIENRVLQDKGVRDALQRLTVDSRCVVVTPFHKIVNRMREIARGEKRYGSTGKGVGEAVSDFETFGDHVLFAGDLTRKDVRKAKLNFIWRAKLDIAEQLLEEHADVPEMQAQFRRLTNIERDILDDTYNSIVTRMGLRIGDERVLKEALSGKTPIIFEGAQGVLLDPVYGFWPHVTKTRTTFENAHALLKDVEFGGDITRIGVVRCYATRHGAGPFVTEEPLLTRVAHLFDRRNGVDGPEQRFLVLDYGAVVAHGAKSKEDTRHHWQGDFRIGWFDAVSTRYAIAAAGGIDALAVTNLDVLNTFCGAYVCTSYKVPSVVHEAMQTFVSANGNTPLLPTREQQIALCGAASKCKPVPEPLDVLPAGKPRNAGPLHVEPDDMIAYARYLAGLVHSTLWLCSMGPTAKDKIEVKSPF